MMAAFSTRLALPLPAAWHRRPLGAALWAWPLAGAGLGALAAAAWAVAHTAWGAPAVAALVALAVLVAVGGALHEDGLADSLDGLAGGTAAERLALMRDSRVGSFGVLGLVLTLRLRWQALAALTPASVPGAVIGVAALSGAPVVAAMALVASARPEGRAADAGRPPGWAAMGAAAAALAVAGPLLGPGAAAVAAFAAAAAVALVVRAAVRRVGGVTGDLLGAAQQAAELAGLIALVARGP